MRPYPLTPQSPPNILCSPLPYPPDHASFSFPLLRLSSATLRGFFPILLKLLPPSILCIPSSLPSSVARPLTLLRLSSPSYPPRPPASTLCPPPAFPSPCLPPPPSAAPARFARSRRVTELQATALQRLFPSTRIASLRIHAIREDYEDAYPSSHSNSLWGWVSFDAISRACLLGLTSEGWGGHEVFYTVASDICWEGGLEYESRLGAGERAKGMEEERVGTRELIKRYYPDAEVDEGWWKEDGRRGCFDCTKAERLLGWRHDA